MNVTEKFNFKLKTFNIVLNQSVLIHKKNEMGRVNFRICECLGLKVLECGFIVSENLCSSREKSALFQGHLSSFCVKAWYN